MQLYWLNNVSTRTVQSPLPTELTIYSVLYTEQYICQLQIQEYQLAFSYTIPMGSFLARKHFPRGTDLPTS
jgi:hypothetical protein